MGVNPFREDTKMETNDSVSKGVITQHFHFHYHVKDIRDLELEAEKRGRKINTEWHKNAHTYHIYHIHTTTQIHTLTQKTNAYITSLTRSFSSS